jgi:hypothetical protein
VARARGDHVVAAQRKWVVYRAERLGAHGTRFHPRLGPAGRRHHTHHRVFKQPVADRDARALELEPAVRRPAVEVSLPVGVVAQDDGAAPAHPLREQCQISRDERVGRRLGLAAEQEDERPVAVEIAAREVGIEAPVLDRVTRGVPGLARAVQERGVRERQVQEQEAPRLRLASGEEEGGDERARSQVAHGVSVAAGGRAGQRGEAE